jgi:hypothetical protein
MILLEGGLRQIVLLALGEVIHILSIGYPQHVHSLRTGYAQTYPHVYLSTGCYAHMHRDKLCTAQCMPVDMWITCKLHVDNYVTDVIHWMYTAYTHAPYCLCTACGQVF